MVQAEDSWTEVELREVDYVAKAQDFLVNTVTDDEIELLKPEIIMTALAGTYAPLDQVLIY